MSLKLVVFDVDGTLVDSQAEILAAMGASFQAQGLEVPDRTAILGIVGLSLSVAMARLAAPQSAAVQAALVEGYKAAYAANRRAGATGPLYPGIRDVLKALQTRDDVLMGVATGKSRRGLDGLIAHHDLSGFFVTRQVADDHPSKPNPSMLHAALSETGAEPGDTVMIGDTSFDMEMARNAQVASIGVSWGYHPRTALAQASRIVDDVAALEQSIDLTLGGIC